MKLGLIVEDEPIARAVSSLVILICRQVGRSVNIHKDRIRIGRGFGSTKKHLTSFVERLVDAGAEIIVVVVDNDRRPRRERFNPLTAEINNIKNLISIPIVKGVAVETIESWMLADENALNSALGETRISRLPVSKIKHPKEEFIRLVKEYANRPPTLNDYSQIGNNVNKRVLDRRSKSFKSFHNELRNCAKII